MNKKTTLLLTIPLLFLGCNEAEVTPIAKVKVEVQEIKKPKDSFEWSSSSTAYISQNDYDDAMEEYIKKTYPKKVKAYKWKKKQEKIKHQRELKQHNTTIINGLMSIFLPQKFIK